MIGSRTWHSASASASLRPRPSIAAVDRYSEDVLAGDWKVPPRGRSTEVSRRDRARGRGRRDRLVRRRRAHREGRRRARRAPGGPARPGSRLPARARASCWTARPCVLVAPHGAGRPAPRRPAPPAGRPWCATTGPAAPAAPGSGSRASTTPSWSRRSGATTCGSRASSWRCWTASTTSRRPCATSRPGPGRRLGVLVDHLVPGSKESRLVSRGRRPAPVRARTCWSSATRTWTSGSRSGRSAWG